MYEQSYNQSGEMSGSRPELENSELRKAVDELVIRFGIDKVRAALEQQARVDTMHERKATVASVEVKPFTPSMIVDPRITDTIKDAAIKEAEAIIRMLQSDPEGSSPGSLGVPFDSAHIQRVVLAIYTPDSRYATDPNDPDASVSLRIETSEGGASWEIEHPKGEIQDHYRTQYPEIQ